MACWEFGSMCWPVSIETARTDPAIIATALPRITFDLASSAQSIFRQSSLAMLTPAMIVAVRQADIRLLRVVIVIGHGRNWRFVEMEVPAMVPVIVKTEMMRSPVCEHRRGK